MLLSCTCQTRQTPVDSHCPHPSSPLPPDGWAFTNNIDINQHQSLEDRLSAARILVQKDPLCPVVVDDMSDTSAIKYGALPERLYVLQGGKVIYKVRIRPPPQPSPASPLPHSFYCTTGNIRYRVKVSDKEALVQLALSQTRGHR